MQLRTGRIGLAVYSNRISRRELVRCDSDMKPEVQPRLT